MSTFFAILAVVFFTAALACPIWAMQTLSKTKPFERHSRELAAKADVFIAERRYDEFYAQQPEFDANLAAWDAQIKRSDKAFVPMAALLAASVACLVLSAVFA